jgi:hypothetical protein
LAENFFFTNASGQRVNSTDFAKSLLASATEPFDAELANRIRAEGNWRKSYQRYFYAVGRTEFSDRNAGFEISRSGLDQLGSLIVNQHGQSLSSLAKAGFAAKALVQTIRIKGEGVPQHYWTESKQSLSALASAWHERGLAEADVVSAFEFLEQNPRLPIAGDLLVALAGNAELSATRDWLSLGGRVAVVARPNPRAWRELVEFARKSAGELLVPVSSTRHLSNDSTDEQIAEVAGLNFVDEIQQTASWLHDLSRLDARLVLASYAYVGGSKQIIAQAAQDALIGVTCENLAKAKVALSWLATPLDIVNAEPALAEKQFAAYAIRSAVEKARDVFWLLFGQLKAASAETIVDGAEPFAIFDASSVRQGSSYLLAKHSEKWRALVAARQGHLTSFTVAPPAKTRSVLRVKILEKTYRGLWRFGVEPFSASATSRAMALILIRNLHDPKSPAAPQNSAKSPLAMVSATAIHGGVWRLGYHPESIWVPATVLGWFAKKTRR